MLKIVLLGAPGSGKGTQSAKLVEKYEVPQISTGDLLRHAVSEQTALGLKAKQAMDAGELVSDDVVVGMIRERLRESDTENGFILDGFPRTLSQAEELDELLAELGRPLHCVIHLKVEDEEIVQRLMARGRDDDNEDIIRNRQSVYREQTEPLVAHYAKQGLLKTVPGVGTVDEIHDRIIDALT